MSNGPMVEASLVGRSARLTPRQAALPCAVPENIDARRRHGSLFIGREDRKNG